MIAVNILGLFWFVVKHADVYTLQPSLACLTTNVTLS